MARRGPQRYVHRPQQVFLRRVTFQVHLWAGIILAAYLCAIGITGSILVFRVEIERICGLKPWQNIPVHKPFVDLAAVVANLRAAYPGSRIVSVQTPSQDDRTFVAVLQRRRETKIACDPNDGHVLGELPVTRNWLDVVQEFHVSLLFPQRGLGRMLNGFGAAVLVLLNATGMVVWWPGMRNWKRAFKIDFKRNWRRINFDAHVAVGFWTLLIVTFWALSGIYFGWPRQIFLLVNSISPVMTARPPAISVTPEAGATAPDLAQLVEQAYTIDPGATLGGVTFPYSSRAPLAILMRRRDTPGYEYVDTVYFNPHNGAYISTWRYGANRSMGDWIIWSLVPLHFGTYWGLGVKILWAAAGLSIPLLAITGLLMYWNRALRRSWIRLRKHGRAARLG